MCEMLWEAWDASGWMWCGVGVGGMLSTAVGPQPLCPCRVAWAAFISTALVNVALLSPGSSEVVTVWILCLRKKITTWVKAWSGVLVIDCL